MLHSSTRRQQMHVVCTHCTNFATRIVYSYVLPGLSTQAYRRSRASSSDDGPDRKQ